MGVLGVALLIAFILLMRPSSDDSNVNVALSANRRAANLDTARQDRTTTTTVPPTETAPVSIPPASSSMPSSSTTIPSTSAPVSLPPTSTAPPPPDKGTVVIKAQLASSRGSVQPAKGVKFYLLDKDIETVLSTAGVTPIEGNTLTGSLGLAAVFPDRYGDFQRAAMRAIGAHAKYSGSTDGSGTANLNGIKPSEYYLFSITRAGRGFAMWDSPISVIAGQNMLDLSPQTITEISDTTGDED